MIVGASAPDSSGRESGANPGLTRSGESDVPDTCHWV